MAISVDKKKTALLVMDCDNDLAHQDGVIAKTMGYAPMIEKNGPLGHIRTVLDAARDHEIVPCRAELSAHGFRS